MLDGAQVADRLQPHLDKGCIDISLLQTRDLTPLEREDLHAWLDSEGHFYDQFIANRDRVTHPFGDYGTYDNEGLRAIAEGGDAKAHMALATRLRDSGAFEGARHHYRESVIHGYTEPLLRLARLDRATQDKSSLSEAERAALDRENIIENRAYIRVYYRLGGPLGEYLIGLPEVQDPDDSESIPFDHTEADIPEIQARADEIYSEIMNDRRSRGIPVDSNQTSAVETMLREDLRLFLAAMERGLVRCDSED